MSNNVKKKLEESILRAFVESGFYLQISTDMLYCTLLERRHGCSPLHNGEVTVMTVTEVLMLLELIAMIIFGVITICMTKK